MITPVQVAHHLDPYPGRGGGWFGVWLGVLSLVWRYDRSIHLARSEQDYPVRATQMFFDQETDCAISWGRLLTPARFMSVPTRFLTPETDMSSATAIWS